MIQSNGFMKDDRKENQSDQSVSTSFDLRKRFGGILCKARELRGLNQIQFAINAGVDAGYISRIENGHRDPPSPRIISQIAGVLGISPEVLMMAAGYLNFDPSAIQDPEDVVYRMIHDMLIRSCASSADRRCGGANPNPTAADSLLSTLVVPLVKQGDKCLAIDAEGEILTGKAVLYLQTSANGTDELHKVESLLCRVE